jgi:hypothetical protein
MNAKGSACPQSCTSDLPLPANFTLLSRNRGRASASNRLMMGEQREHEGRGKMRKLLTLGAILTLAGLFPVANAGEPAKRKSIFKKPTPGAVGGAMGQLLKMTPVPVQAEPPKPIKGKPVQSKPKPKPKKK